MRQDVGQFWLPDADTSKFSTPEWRDEITVVSDDPDYRIYHHTITTPNGKLTYKTSGNRKTTWITELLYRCVDKPDWVHELLRILLEKKLRFIESMRGAKFDLIETGGGAASSTVISPKLHREFCLPYDREMHDALPEAGFLITYHTCGGTSKIEDLIARK